MTIGAKVREVRKKRGLSMAELGRKIGVSAAAVSRYELGQRALTLDMLELIADALETHVLEFVCEENSGDGLTYEIKDAYDSLPVQRQAYFWESLGTAQLRKKLAVAFEQLNIEGQKKAVERVEEIAEIPRYRRQDTPLPSPTSTDPPVTEPPTEDA